jgi:Tfp pilus assembly protein PilO
MNREPEFELQDTIVEPLEEQTEVLVTPATLATPAASAASAASAPSATSGGAMPDVPAAIAAPTATSIERKVRGGMFGVPEMVVMALSALVLLGVLGFYFLVVAPAASDLKARKAQHDDQETKLNNLKKQFGNSTSIEQKVSQLEQSVSNFESRYLPIASIGQTGLYDRLNGLMYAYHLRNTAGPDYVPLEIISQRNDQPQGERGKNKFQTLFPGVYINMTVEGTYPNLRRFIGEIEASPQFVVISTVELQSTESKEQEDMSKFQPPASAQGPNSIGGGKMPGGPVTGPPLQTRPAERKGKTLGEVVSLHIELAAYFRREAAPGSALPAPAAQ